MYVYVHLEARNQSQVFCQSFYAFKTYFKKFEVIMYNVIISFPYPFPSLYSLPCIPPHVQIHALFVYCCLSHTRMLTCIPQYMNSTCSDHIMLVLCIRFQGWASVIKYQLACFSMGKTTSCAYKRSLVACGSSYTGSFTSCFLHPSTLLCLLASSLCSSCVRSHDVRLHRYSFWYI